MMAMFLRHCARFFNYSGWHIKNNQLSYGFSIFVSLVDQWVMPLFFILAAMSAWYALTRLSGSQYLLRRVKRLLVPLLFGVLVIIPPQYFIQDVSGGQSSGSFLEYLPWYYKHVVHRLWNGDLAHLWFLEKLFLFTILFLPIFMALRHHRLNNLIEKSVIFFQKPAAIFLFTIPLAAAETIAAAEKNTFIGRLWGGWSLLTYAVLFGLGYILAMDPRFRSAMERQRLPALVIAVLTALAGLAWFLSQNASIAFPPILRAISSWSWLVAILGYGSKYLTHSTSLLSYTSPAVLPLYILHQTVIVMIGYGISDWEMDPAIKYLLLSMVSFIIMIGIYHFAIKQVNVLRVLFGMRPNAPSRHVLTPESPGI